MLGQWHQGGGHWAGGVDDSAEVGIVKIEYMGADAVEQRCMRNIDQRGAAKYRGLRLSHERA
jgi:hypothetical protein